MTADYDIILDLATDSSAVTRDQLVTVIKNKLNGNSKHNITVLSDGRTEHPFSDARSVVSEDTIDLLFKAKTKLDDAGVTDFLLVTTLIMKKYWETVCLHMFSAVHNWSVKGVDVSGQVVGIDLSREQQVETSFKEYLKTLGNIDEVRILRSDVIPESMFNAGFHERYGGVTQYAPLASLNMLYTIKKTDPLLVIKENRRRLAVSAGFDVESLQIAKVEHGKNIWVVGKEQPPRYDGMVTNIPGVTLAAPGADCCMILFANVQTGILGTLCDNGFYSKPLDVFCSEKVSGNYSYSTRPKLEKYFRMCRDVEMYVDCVVATRTNATTPPGVEVQLYQKDFPSEYDLKVATFKLCSQNLFELEKHFGMDVLNCEGQCDDRTCRTLFARVEDLQLLDTALNTQPYDKNLVSNLSCNILGPIVDCFEKQYTDCDSNYEEFRNYELATLGGNDGITQSTTKAVTDGKADWLSHRPVWRACGAVHAGWRGTVVGAVRSCLKTMVDEFGTDPKDVHVAIGPSIETSCFTLPITEAIPIIDLDPSLVYPSASNSKFVHVDLVGANVAMLERDGVLRSNIDTTHALCTVCNKQFFSYQRDSIPFGNQFGFISRRKEN